MIGTVQTNAAVQLAARIESDYNRLRPSLQITLRPELNYDQQEHCLS